MQHFILWKLMGLMWLVSPSRLLIPVSYFAILGGVCTLIGTSTTLVINANLQIEYAQRQADLREYQKENPDDDKGIDKRKQFAESCRPMSLLEVGKVGLPCALVGGVFLLIVGPRLLPNRTDMLEKLGEQRREYLVEMLVLDECKLIGKSVEAAMSTASVPSWL